MVIISSRDQNGKWRGSPAELADQVLDVAPEAVCTVLKGLDPGIRVSEQAAAAWLSGPGTATGKRRKGV